VVREGWKLGENKGHNFAVVLFCAVLQELFSELPSSEAIYRLLMARPGLSEQVCLYPKSSALAG
jgi:hypothetical protein